MQSPQKEKGNSKPDDELSGFDRKGPKLRPAQGRRARTTDDVAGVTEHRASQGTINCRTRTIPNRRKAYQTEFCESTRTCGKRDRGVRGQRSRSAVGGQRSGLQANPRNSRPLSGRGPCWAASPE